jgi:hypothetical protein
VTPEEPTRADTNDDQTAAGGLRLSFARLGVLAFATALLAAAGAIFVADDREIASVCATTGLLCSAMGIVLTGAPFARTGKPSLLRIVALFAAGLGGLALMLAVGDVVVIAVVSVSYAIVLLSLSRWTPAEWQSRPKHIRTTRPPLGGLVASFGTVFAFLGLAGVIVDATEPGPVRVVLAVVLAVVALQVWVWLAIVYAGKRPPLHRRSTDWPPRTF